MFPGGDITAKEIGRTPIGIWPISDLVAALSNGDGCA
jgi:hypothetical protein